MRRVAIVGGGIAGLTAAYELAMRGDGRDNMEAALYEESARLGGIVSTVREGGFTVECGPDAWVTEKPWMRELVDELGLGDQVIPSLDAGRKTYVLQGSKLVAIPDGMRLMVPGDLEAMRRSQLFTAETKAACEAEVGRAEELRASIPAGDESVAAFVRRHFGEEMLRKVGAPLLSGVFGGDVERLSVRAVMPQFVAMEREHGSLITAVQAKQSAAAKAIFSTLCPGMGALVDALAARIPVSWVRLNTVVSCVAHEGTAWMVDGERFDAVLLAAPVDVAQRLLLPMDARAAELMEMETSSAVSVGLGFAERFALPAGFGFLVPQGEGSELLACTFADQKFEGRVPSGGRLLRGFFGGARLLGWSDDALVVLALRELEAVLGPLPEPVMRVVRRLPRSLPQYAVGHMERMAELDARVRALPGLALAGNGYRGVGLPEIVRDARAAARGI